MSVDRPSNLALALAALALGAGCNPDKRLETTVNRLLAENQRLQAEIESLKASRGEARPSGRRDAGTEPGPDASEAELTLERAAPLERRHDPESGVTTLSTGYAGFESEGFLPVKQWLALSASFEEGESPNSLDDVTMTLRTKRSQGRYAGRDEVVFHVDGEEVPCRVTDYAVDRASTTRGRRTRVDKDETLLVRIPRDALRRIALGREVRFDRDRLKLSREQRILLARILDAIARPAAEKTE